MKGQPYRITGTMRLAKNQETLVSKNYKGPFFGYLHFFFDMIQAMAKQKNKKKDFEYEFSVKPQHDQLV